MAHAAMIDLMKQRLSMKIESTGPTTISSNIENERKRFIDDWRQRKQLRRDSLESSELSSRLIITRLATINSVSGFNSFRTMKRL